MQSEGYIFDIALIVACCAAHLETNLAKHNSNGVSTLDAGGVTRKPCGGTPSLDQPQQSSSKAIQALDNGKRAREDIDQCLLLALPGTC
jgi:hypothetical protein